MEDFRLEYNAERPHRSLGYLSPQRFGTGKSLPIPSSGPDRQAGPSLRLGLPTTTAVITSNNARTNIPPGPVFGTRSGGSAPVGPLRRPYS
ncbi:MAG: hypothetical protein EXS38_00315 [Opitutus sp.]|nr:hypothetical protein [Opitutus sp.]